MGKVIIHLHVPKCAGSSINKVLSDHFGRKCLAFDNQEQRAAFLEMSQDERDEKYEAVIGHVRYGLGDYFGKDVVYISAVRPSIDRILSYFNYIHLTPDHPLHALFKSELLSINDLTDEFMSANPGIMAEWRNAYCRAYFGETVSTVQGFNHHRQIMFKEMREHRFIVGSLGMIERYLRQEGVLAKKAKLPVINKAADKIPEHEFEVAKMSRLKFSTLAVLNKMNMFDNVLLDKVAEYEMRNGGRLQKKLRADRKAESEQEISA